MCPFTGAMTLREKATIHQITTMLATSKNVLFGLNIFYSSQDMIKGQAEQEDMFSPLHA